MITAYTMFNGAETMVTIPTKKTMEQDDFDRELACMLPDGTTRLILGRHLFVTVPRMRQGFAIEAKMKAEADAGFPMSESAIGLWYERNPVEGFVTQ